jgi:translation initiation factor 2-alpha kinase 1
MGILGEGAYGVVEKAYSLIDNNLYAIKKVYLKHVDPEVFRETMYLSRLQNINIVRYYSSWLDFEYSEDYEETLPTLFIQMELCDTSLRDWLIDNHNLDFNIKKNIFTDIVNGIKYLHDSGLIHRDIKPENIFLKYENKRLVAKIGDFGLSKWIVEQPKLKIEKHNAIILFEPRSDSKLTNYIGTELYSSPEQLGGKKYDFKTDIYSLGIMILDFFHEYKTQSERISIIKKFRNDNMIDTNFKFIEIIRILCNTNPLERPTIDYITEIFNNDKLT